MIKIITGYILLVFMAASAAIIFAGCEENGETKIEGKKTVVDQIGKLSVSEGQLVGENGKEISLRGMSLFWSQIKGKYYNYDCVKWLRDNWYCTVVRAAMGIETADGIEGYLVNKETEKEKIFNVIEAAIDLGIYVIVDWHDHHAHDNADEAEAFFKEVAALYGDKPNIIYEIYNEPMQISWTETVRPYSQRIIETIRAVDPDNVIIVGTTTWSQDVDQAAANPLEGTNLVYSLHFYASSHKQELRNKAETAIQLGAPLFVSEFGVCEYTGNGIIDTDENDKWFEFMEQNNISWCNWSVGDKNESSAALVPGASAEGGWEAADLTQSGLMLKQKLRMLNKEYFESSE